MSTIEMTHEVININRIINHLLIKYPQLQEICKDDLIQTACIASWEAVKKFKKSSKMSISFFLYCKILSACLKLAKNELNTVSLDDILIEDDCNIENEAIENEIKGMLLKALCSLTEREYDAIDYVGFEGLSYRETAAKMGISMTRVFQLLQSAKKKIKEYFINNEYEL